jgi:predicted ATP-grasp superfamily ATP-dependent carboligase
VLSGGAEIVGAALVEEFQGAGIEVALISMGQVSLLRGEIPSERYAEIAWPPVSPHAGVTHLVEALTKMGAGRPVPWPIFATEDGGLRLLLEGQEMLRSLVVFGHARRLRWGGLDKAELFLALESAGLSNVCAPTYVANQPDDVGRLAARLGTNCIVKPAMKPLSMRLPGMTSKIVTWDPATRSAAREEQLRLVWPLSSRWVVQKTLACPAEGEAVWWGVASKSGSLACGCSAFERWKYPATGGSGCWVCTESVDVPELRDIATKVVRAIDFVGLLELPFLKDDQGRWRLLELNPRAWLQIGLPGRCGMPLALQAYEVLLGEAPSKALVVRAACWVNVERILASAFSGDHGRRLPALIGALRVIRQSEVVAMHDTPFRGLRLRWLARAARRGLARLYKSWDRAT